MAKTIKMPVLGNSVEEVRIVQWFKKVGDSVTAGEPLAEVETDKTNVEFESPESGIVRKILAPVDAYVKVEAPVVIIGTADELIGDEHSSGPNPDDCRASCRNPADSPSTTHSPIPTFLHSPPQRFSVRARVAPPII